MIDTPKDAAGRLAKALEISSGPEFDISITPATARALLAERERLREALRGLEPYLDAIVCYASSMDEHEPNRLAFNAREALQGAYPAHVGGKGNGSSSASLPAALRATDEPSPAGKGRA